MSAQNWLFWADRAYFTFAIIAAVATGLTIVAGIAQNKLNATISSQKDKEFRTFQTNANLEIAQLNLANSKLEQRLAWRRISPAQRDTMVNALTPFAGAQIVLDPEGNGDPEVDTFSRDLYNIFVASNWTVLVDSGNIRIPAPVGTTCLVDPKNPAATVLLQQMESAPGGCTPLTWSGGLKITIGIRPPP